MKNLTEINKEESNIVILQNKNVISNPTREINEKNLNKNIKTQLILNISLLCLGVFINLLIAFLTNLTISFLYGFLISIPFIIFAIYMNYYELKKLKHVVKARKFTFFMLIYFIKYLIIVVLLAIAIILLILKIESSVINLYGILFGVIILIAIIMNSIYFFKKSLNTFQK